MSQPPESPGQFPAGVKGIGGAVVPPDDATSPSLLARVRAMDPDGWVRLVRLYGPLVYRWCRQGGWQEADAADIGQEVFRAVAGGIGGFRRDRPGDSFRKWLRAITRSRMTDAARRKARGPVTGDSDAGAAVAAFLDPDPDPLARAEADEDADLVRRAVELALESVRPAGRAAFRRVVVGGEDVAAVAAELGLSPNAVYVTVSRVRKRLRDEFSDLIDDL